MPHRQCPPPEQLERLLEEQLDDAARQAVSTHLDACPLCQQPLERLTEATEASDTSLLSIRRLHVPASTEATPDPFLARLKLPRA
jgi:hypothetical protein